MGNDEMLEKINGQVPSKKDSCWGKSCWVVSRKRGGSGEVLEGGTGRRGWSRSVVGLVLLPCSCPEGPCPSRSQSAAGPGW